jgi:hypothetical protein
VLLIDDQKRLIRLVQGSTAMDSSFETLVAVGETETLQGFHVDGARLGLLVEDGQTGRRIDLYTFPGLELEGEVDLAGYWALRLRIGPDKAYVGGNFGLGVLVFDLADLAAPRLAAQLGPAEGFTPVSDGDLVWINSGGFTHAFDVRDVDAIALVGSAPDSGGVYPRIEGNTLFTLRQAFDITDPASPQRIATFGDHNASRTLTGSGTLVRTSPTAIEAYVGLVR